MRRWRRIGMKLTLARRVDARAAALAACAAGGLLVAGCGGALSPSSPGPAAAAREAGGSAPVAAHAAAGTSMRGGVLAPAGAVGGAARSAASGQAHAKVALPLAPGTDIVYTANLSVRARDVAHADTLAQTLVSAVGGYVANENTSIDPAHPADSTVSLELKIPASAYATTLDKLATQLGKQVSLQQQAQDVTESVADVGSRVASAQSALSQLRTLLSRAQSVADMLTIQDQITQQEADLESLQAQQRALAHETAYATVSLQIIGIPPPAPRPARHAHTSGFVRGLTAGWKALRVFGNGLLAVLGAVIPFTLLIIAAGYLAYRHRRWLLRRRTPPAQEA